MSRCFHDCTLWKTKVYFYFGNLCFLCNLMGQHVYSLGFAHRAAVTIHGPLSLGTCSLSVVSPNMEPRQTQIERSVNVSASNSNVVSPLEAVISRADNHRVRDESNYSLGPGSPQSFCCCSAVPPPTAVWLSAWLPCSKCCCSWARSKRRRES